MKSKRLTLDEIYRVYQLLRPAIEGRELENNLIDETFKIIELSSPDALLACVKIMYDNKARFSNPMEFNLLFINGLSRNDFFSFCKYIGVLNGISKQ